MYKRICDKCGKEITREWHDGIYTIAKNDRHHTEHGIDLCDPCLKIFDTWLTNK